MGFPKLGVSVWAPNNEVYSILRSILGSPYSGKLLSKSCWKGTKQSVRDFLVRLARGSATEQTPRPMVVGFRV